MGRHHRTDYEAGRSTVELTLLLGLNFIFIEKLTMSKLHQNTIIQLILNTLFIVGSIIIPMLCGGLMVIMYLYFQRFLNVVFVLGDTNGFYDVLVSIFLFVVVFFIAFFYYLKFGALKFSWFKKHNSQ